MAGREGEGEGTHCSFFAAPLAALSLTLLCFAIVLEVFPSRPKKCIVFHTVVVGLDGTAALLCAGIAGGAGCWCWSTE